MILLKYHGNVTKEPNPLLVNNLIKNKSLANFEAPRRNLKTKWVKILFFQIQKNS